MTGQRTLAALAGVVALCALTACGETNEVDVVAPDPEPAASAVFSPDPALVAACRAERATLHTAWAAARASSLGGAAFDPLQFLNDPADVTYFVMSSAVEHDGGMLERTRLDQVPASDCSPLDVDEDTATTMAVGG